MELQGKIISVLPTLSGQGKRGAWMKNQFVVEWLDNGYTQRLCLEVVGEDRWDKMKSSVVVGNEVIVRFSVTSREYQGKWFTSASCFYCSRMGGQQQQQQPTQSNATTTTGNGGGQPTNTQAQESDESEIPF